MYLHQVQNDQSIPNIKGAHIFIRKYFRYRSSLSNTSQFHVTKNTDTELQITLFI